MKNINWKGIAITAAVSIVAVVVVYPLLRPYLQKVPAVGKFFN